MNKYLKPTLEEIIVVSSDVILSSNIEINETNATFGGSTPDEIM